MVDVEQHALRAIAEGGMNVRAPNGEIIRLRYERHIEHPDGNWTWIGRKDGSAAGTESVLTFGERAVFGTIRQGNNDLRLTTEAGSTWLVETDYTRVDPKAIPRNDDDFLAAGDPAALLGGNVPGLPKAASGQQQVAAVSAAANAVAVATPTIDVAMGYTTGFATRLGGESQARTRLHFLVDAANQAYVASGINGQLRLVHSVQVNYPDGTHNDSALFDLTGVDCTQAANGAFYRSFARFSCTQKAHPAALLPLVAARTTHAADLLVLIRKFESSSTSCGVAWLLGGGQKPITSSSATFGTSVVNDSSGEMFPDNGTTCPDLHLAHELGHNMGQQHDTITAQGLDDSDSNGNLLDPEEYGRHSYSFGYSTDDTANDIATIMSNRRTGQTRYKVFANPLISVCGGMPCGTADQADNARSMNETMPIIAAFRPPMLPTASRARNDVDGDGRSDLVWRGGSSFVMWLMNGAFVDSVRTLSLSSTFRLVATGDLNGDGKLDEVWRQGNDTQLRIWLGTGTGGYTGYWLSTGLGADWQVVGAGDVDGDGDSDLLWRGTAASNNFMVWFMNGATHTGTRVVSLSTGYSLAATGDFNGDGKLDEAWRQGSSTQLRLWLGDGTGGYTGYWVTSALGAGWTVAGAGDVNGDGKTDLIWRGNTASNNVVIWFMNGATITSTKTLSLSTSYKLVATGDYNGDGKLDQVWRSGSSTQLRLWMGTGTGGYTGYWVDSPYGSGWSVVP